MIEFVEWLMRKYTSHSVLCADSPEVVFLMKYANLGIAICYYYISILLFILAYTRKDFKNNKIFQIALFLFGAFVMFCGIGHNIAYFNVEAGLYRFQAIWAVLTLLVSLSSGVFFTYNFSFAVKLPSIKQYRLIKQEKINLTEENKALEERINDYERLESFALLNLQRINGLSLTKQLLNVMEAMSYRGLPVSYVYWNNHHIEGKIGRLIGLFKNDNVLYVYGEYEKTYLMDYHKHVEQDEMILILEGEMEMLIIEDENVTEEQIIKNQVEHKRVVVKELQTIYIKKNLWHHTTFNKDTKLFIGWSPKKDEYITAVPLLR